jgi:pimeloyl-ACP methyl ester carboxylesterase
VRDYVEEFAARITGAQIERIEGAGHLPHLEQSQVGARVVAAFVGQPQPG